MRRRRLSRASPALLVDADSTFATSLAQPKETPCDRIPAGPRSGPTRYSLPHSRSPYWPRLRSAARSRRQLSEQADSLRRSALPRAAAPISGPHRWRRSSPILSASRWSSRTAPAQAAARGRLRAEPAGRRPHRCDRRHRPARGRDRDLSRQAAVPSDPDADADHDAGSYPLVLSGPPTIGSRPSRTSSPTARPIRTSRTIQPRRRPSPSRPSCSS